MCDVSPLEVCDFLLGQTCMWKLHDVYEYRPRCVIVTLGKQLCRIPEAFSKAVMSLIIAKQCRKAISQTGKFVLFTIHSESK